MVNVVQGISPYSINPNFTKVGNNYASNDRVLSNGQGTWIGAMPGQLDPTKNVSGMWGGNSGVSAADLEAAKAFLSGSTGSAVAQRQLQENAAKGVTFDRTSGKWTGSYAPTPAGGLGGGPQMAPGGGYATAVMPRGSDGGMGGGMGKPGKEGRGPFGSNPYLGGYIDYMGQEAQDFLGQAFNQIRGNSVMNGTMGGSRQGVAEGQAIGSAFQDFMGQGYGFLGNQRNQDETRNLQRYGMNLNDQTANRGLDLQQFGLAMNGLNNAQQGAWQPINNWSNNLSPWSGNGTTTSTQNSGGGWQGVLGGLLGGGQLAKNFGWFGS
jgi:hypothetical protein